MISFEKAVSIVQNSCKKMDIEEVELHQLLGRVLALDVVSDMNMPPFDKSAVDGFACRKSNITEQLEVIEVVPAGKLPREEVGEHQCTKIMTGAMMPKGADCVIMIEDTAQVDCLHIRYKKDTVKNNICLLGEDMKTGQVAISAGVAIQPQHIAVLAALGYTKVAVYQKPRVAILSTGDELVEPSKKPELGQIRNSNGHQLVAQVLRAGCIPNYMGIVEDNERVTFNAIKKAIDENDMLLLTGGVSMGDYDFVPSVLTRCGVDLLFDRVAVQPGKPTTFGKTDSGKMVFGLPGNPVSSFAQFELLVRPALEKMMGEKPKELFKKMRLSTDYHRKHAERLAFVPATISQSGEVTPTEYHGSAHIFSLPNSQGLLAVPLGIYELKKGEEVDVRPI